MKLTKLAVVGLAVLLVTAGAATALPGNAPDHAGDDAQADDHRQDGEQRPDDPGNASDAPADAADTASDAPTAAANEIDRGATVDDRGPPVDLPAAVPDHVSAIHDLIRDYLDGSLDGDLGQAIADVTPDDADAES